MLILWWVIWGRDKPNIQKLAGNADLRFELSVDATTNEISIATYWM